MLAAMLLAVTNPADFGLGTEWKPLANVRDEFISGQLECDTPDHAAKTCEGLTQYTLRNDGRFDAVVILPINNEPDLSIVMPVSPWLEGDNLCVRMQQSDFNQMFLLLGKSKYEKPAGQKLLAEFRQAMAEMTKDKLICSQFFADGDRRYTVTLVDGVHTPDLDGEWAWLRHDAGYDLRASENFLEQ